MAKDPKPEAREWAAIIDTHERSPSMLYDWPFDTKKWSDESRRRWAVVHVREVLENGDGD